MSKEFDEFMSSMSEIPNNSNDVREEMDLLKILTKKVKTEISDTSTNSSSYSSGYRQAMIIVESWIIDILAQVPQQKENTYTEEQVREAIELATTTKHSGTSLFYNADEIIQSLKQHK